MSSAFLMFANNAEAQNQTVNVKTFLSVRPTVVGVGQEILINMWISPAPGAHRLYQFECNYNKS